MDEKASQIEEVLNLVFGTDQDVLSIFENNVKPLCSTSFHFSDFFITEAQIPKQTKMQVLRYYIFQIFLQYGVLIENNETDPLSEPSYQKVFRYVQRTLILAPLFGPNTVYEILQLIHQEFHEIYPLSVQRLFSDFGFSENDEFHFKENSVERFRYHEAVKEKPPPKKKSKKSQLQIPSSLYLSPKLKEYDLYELNPVSFK